VVVEKPLCTTLADADRLVAAGGHRLLYAENLAASPVVRRFVDLAGTIGPLTHLEARTVQSLPTWGAFTTEAWGGGALFDLGVHPLAVVLLAARPARPVAVRCMLEGSVGHPTDEHAELTIEFDSGLTARVVSSWRGGAVPQWDAQAASATGVVRAELFPLLAIEHNGEEIPLARARTQPPQLEDFGYAGQLAGFAADLQAGRRPLMDAGFGRAVLDVVCAAYRSAGRGGAPEPLPFTGPRDRTPLQLWRDG
jgi:predicted dehydrogenase